MAREYDHIIVGYPKMACNNDENDESAPLLALRHSHPPLGTGGDSHPPALDLPWQHPPSSLESVPSISRLTYYDFLATNRNYRWFITSYLITHFGEWLTYIASIDFIETVRATHHQSTSRTAISILILARLLPNVVLSALGGSLADCLDRRYVMIGLDLCGATCSGLFLYAYHVKSIFLLYVASAVQQCIAGLYAPSHSAIVPQLVKSDVELKKATTLEGLTWSAMQAFGAAASGWIVDVLGIKMCFIIDGLSYAISALFLTLLHGSFLVEEAENDSKDSAAGRGNSTDDRNPISRFYHMVMDATTYLYSSHFAALVLLKGTAALGYGACDVLNVAFSEDDSNSEFSLSPNQKMGILFSLVGTGCLLGPIAAEPFVHVEQPKTLQVSCIIAFALSTIGYFGWAIAPHFGLICIFAVIRAAGSSNVCIHSTLLLQKFSVPQMMGRVLAADYAIALVCEAAAAYICGVFMDHQPAWTPYDVSLVLAILTAGITATWIVYHLAGRGACRYQNEGLGREEASDVTENPGFLSENNGGGNMKQQVR